MRITTRSFPIIAVIVAAALLPMAPAAAAIYIVTPLILQCEDKADVGDALALDIAPHPDNASAADDWAGKTVTLRYSYDKNEGSEGGPENDSGHTERDVGTITLDDEARATHTWTVPDEVQDRNVNLFLQDGAGERLAFAYVAVGNATPMMHLMSGPGSEESAPIEDEQEDASAETDEAPAPGIVGILALLGLVAVARPRRR